MIALIGPYTQGELRVVQEAAVQNGANVRLYRKERDAVAAMRQFPPCGVFLHPAARQDVVYQALRSDPRLFATPTIETFHVLDAVNMRCAMKRGADDIANIGDVQNLSDLIRKLTRHGRSSLPPVTEGRAVVAHFDEKMRLLIGRAMRLAGFEVDFVANQHELLSRESADVLVISEELSLEIALTSSAVHYEATIVITDQEGPADYASRTKTAYVGQGSLLNDVPFLAGELRRPTAGKQRASKRLLYSAMCTFRMPGGSVRHGYVYNVSEGGMFIRTITPLASGSSVWIEMEPYETGLVHLRGEVVQSCEHARSRGGSPAGFGVRIANDECPRLDLAAYRQAYRTFLEVTERRDQEPQTSIVARIAEAETSHEQARATIPTRQPTVLVIDDESSVCRSIARRLQKAGYKTICASNGEEGLVHLREADIHVVVSDITMPVLNGLELVNKMQGFARDIPVVLLSGGYLSSDTTKDASKYVFDFLPKPINADKLVSTVAAAARTYQTVSRGRASVA